MSRSIKIENSTIGENVELRDITVRQWRDIQKANLDDGDIGITMLADMLYSDGVQVGMDRILDMAMNDILPLLSKVTAMMNGDVGEDGSPKNG